MLTLLRIGWMNLKRDRVAQALTFLLPIVFFSIFASVFGGQGGDSTPRIRSRSSTRITPSSASASIAGAAEGEGAAACASTADAKARRAL